MTMLPAPIVDAQNAMTRAHHLREFEPELALSRKAKREADAIAEWGAVEGSLRFYRCSSMLLILRERSGTVDGAFEYFHPGAMQIEWSEILQVAWRLHGEVSVRTDGVWRKQKQL